MTIAPSHRNRSLCSECRWLTAATPSDKARPDNGWRGGRVRDLDWRLQERRPFRRRPRSPCWSRGNVGDSCSPRWGVCYNVEAQRSIFRGGVPGSSGAQTRLSFRSVLVSALEKWGNWRRSVGQRDSTNVDWEALTVLRGKPDLLRNPCWSGGNAGASAFPKVRGEVLWEDIRKKWGYVLKYCDLGKLWPLESTTTL